MTNAVSIAQYGSTGTTTGFKNRIINGAMVIDQRDSGASVTPTTNLTYILDRWSAVLTAASKYSVQQNAGSVTPPIGYTNYLGVTSLSAYSVGSGDLFQIRQAIEGYNVADLGWGTANAKTITLSFQVYSSLTGTFGGCLNNGAGNRTYLFQYTVSSANTWTPITITIAGDTTGTWLTTNGSGLEVRFGLGAGSTYSGTANTWSSSTVYQPTGAVSVVGTNGATFYITGVQLEVGSSATSFDYRPYGTELALCLRYCVLFAAGGESLGPFAAWTSGSGWCNTRAPLPMRAPPTATITTGTNYYSGYIAGNQYTNNSLSLTWTSSGAGNCQGLLFFNSSGWSGSMPAGGAGGMQLNDPGAKIIISAEL
jgi:hypothetical protein